MTKIALVLGASGGIGGETARALHRRGWQIRALSRAPREGSAPGYSWIRGDALDPDAVRLAAAGAAVIVHAVNPPGYRDWDRLVLPMLDNSIAAARAGDARILLPGTIYNYDPRGGSVAAPDTPQRPTTRKGRIRVAMEQRLQRSGVATLILRAGDFFGPRAGNNWLSQGMIRPGRPIARVTNPGRPGVGHAWAYLPDVGEAFARLIAAPGLPRFARHHFAGHWDGDGDGFARAVAAAAGPNVGVTPLRWPLLRFAAPFNETIRELREMRPFWDHSLSLDNSTLVDAIGAEPHTPLEEALHTTLAALGCVGVP